MGEAPPFSAAPEPQNEEPSHSFVVSLAKPIAATTADDSDEWEYEYSTTETEVCLNFETLRALKLTSLDILPNC